MLKILCCIVVLFISNHIVGSIKLPSHWPRCSRKGDNADCLSKAIMFAVKDLKNGNKTLGILPLDPLRFDVMEIQQGGSSSVNLNLTYNNVDLIGSQDINIFNTKIDWDKYSIETNFSFDKPFNIIGEYSMEGKMIVLPVRGHGKANITLHGFSGKLTLKGKELLKGKKNYFDPVSSNFLVDIKKCSAYFSNLFEDVENLGERINSFINENWPVIIEELRGPISDVMGEAAIKLSREFFLRVPVDNIALS